MQWTRGVAALGTLAVFCACSGGSNSSVSTPPVGKQSLRTGAAAASGAGCTTSGSIPGRVLKVSPISTSDAWAVGTDQFNTLTVWHDVNGVVVATYAPAPQFAQPYDILALTDRDVWVVGYTTQAPALLLHWDGSQWSLVANPPGIDPTQVAFQAVSGLAANDVWVAGKYTPPTGGNTHAVLEHWDGSKMHLVGVSPYNDDFVHSVIEFSPTNVWMFIDAPSIHPQVAQWNGTHFSFQDLPVTASGQNTIAQQMSASGPNNMWAVGYLVQNTGSQQNFVGEIWHYDGAQWQPYTYTSPSAPVFTGVAALASNDAVIVGYTQPLNPLALTYQNTIRWHPVASSFASAPIGQTAQVPGTKSFWTELSDGSTYASNQAVLVTCP